MMNQKQNKKKKWQKSRENHQFKCFTMATFSARYSFFVFFLPIQTINNEIELYTSFAILNIIIIINPNKLHWNRFEWFKRSFICKIYTVLQLASWLPILIRFERNYFAPLFAHIIIGKMSLIQHLSLITAG